MTTHPVTQYALDVVEGRIVAGQLVRYACQRHLGDLEASRDRSFPYVFDEEAADHFLDFCPLCCHYEGEWAGQPFVPEPWETFIFGSVFGWLYRSTGDRRFRKAYVSVGRKNGKTLLAVVVGYYGLLVDGEPGAQIITFANSRDQVDSTLFRAAVEVREHSPALRARVGSGNNSLFVASTSSIWRTLPNNSRKWDGLNVHIALADEVHEQDGNTYRVVESSMGARRQPLVMATTTAGFNEAGFGGQLNGYMKRVVTPGSGFENDQIFAYIATLDKDDDPDDEEVWIKANPNLGVSKKPEWLRGESLKSLAMGGDERTNFLVKELNVWSTQTESWLDLKNWDACNGSIDLSVLRGQRAIGGLDISSTLDLTAFVLVFHELDPMPVLPFFWHPEENAKKRADVDRVPYGLWADKGLIELTPGSRVDQEFIERQIQDLSREFPGFRRFGYDPHEATRLSVDLQNFGLEPIRIDQTHAALNEASRKLETLVATKKLVHGGHPILRWNAENAVIKRNAAGKIKPIKADHRKRVDGIAAFVIALAVIVREPSEPEHKVEFHRPPSSRPRDFLELLG